MRLLERQSHLDALTQYAAEARAGQGRLVLVAGEAGVGKSSLLEQFKQTLPDARWWEGACDGLFTPRPLAPVLDIAAALGGELAELCRADTPREQMFAAILEQIQAPDALTVVAIEDVHWADEATLDLLRFIGRRIRDVPALLLVTYRDEGLSPDHPLRIVIGELATHRTARRLSVPALSAQAVAEMVEGTALEPAHLYRLTGGNPFYLAEILRDGVAELPASARDAVLAHVARLSDEARPVLEVAALIGARVEPVLLAAVTHARPDVVDELLACGVLIGDCDLLRFRHEIARLVVEQAIAVHRRRPIHRGVLDALLATGCDDTARLAFHAEGAGDAARVLEFAPQAARRAAELAAHREAAAQYERALRFSSATDPRTAADLQDSLATELSLIDRWQDCADACHAALAVWREVGDPMRAGATLGQLSRAMWRLCRGPESHAAAEEGVAVLEPLGLTAEIASAYHNLASTRMRQQRHDEAIDFARRARALAEALRRYDVLSDAFNTEGCAAVELGGDGHGPLERALEIALRHGLPEQAGRAYTNLYAMSGDTLNFAEGEHYYTDGVAFCDEHDISTFGTCLRGERTVTLDRMGRWDEAVALCQRLLDQVASPVNRLNPLITLGKLRARRGSADAWDCLDEAASSADELGEPPWIVLARLARAEAHWLSGAADAAACEVELAELAVATSGAVARSAVAAWRRRLGGTGEAGSATDTELDPVLDPGLLEPYRSELAGDPVRAAQLWDDLDCPYPAALALLDTTDEALLRDSLARLERLGAVATAQLARRTMRDLGITSIPSGARSTTRQSPAGLTRRETEVLELICDGHTNEEISGRLFISTKTVDHHVSAVLGKLGVPSRKVAAAEAVRLGLVGAAT